ncbi:expressed unknown protein [Seminavis robusta]|uniref:Uncharacterized protein n=1 Tax=Seminavis robusta TaxID=568900 RepID=A0A9N8DG80_9STRA|nr:expressed unknown protein [Seminavis robusta]|eukprot:Sro104_g052730.1 n/a (154) ;mRNA; r:30545-31093
MYLEPHYPGIFFAVSSLLVSLFVGFPGITVLGLIPTGIALCGLKARHALKRWVWALGLAAGFVCACMNICGAVVFACTVVSDYASDATEYDVLYGCDSETHRLLTAVNGILWFMMVIFISHMKVEGSFHNAHSELPLSSADTIVTEVKLSEVY